MKRRTSIFVALFSVSSLASAALAQAPGEVEIEVEAAPPPARPAPAPRTAPQAPRGARPIEPAPEATSPVAPEPPPIVPASQEELAALRAELVALEQRLAASEAARAEERARDEARASEAERARAQEREAEHERSLRERVAKLGVTISGYVQAQYTRNQFSQDQLQQGGAALNQDRFAVRRGRLRVAGRWKYARADFELDASNTRGPTASVRRAAVGAVLPNSEPGALPYLTLQAGITEIPFGLEVQQGQDQILFMERTAGSLAFFSGPIDTGVRLDAAYGPFRAQLAVMNGVPIDDRAGGPSGIDFARSPDYVGRVGVDTLPLDFLRIAGGVSFLVGRGFHPGSDATKPVLQWDDSNADGVINAGELVAVAGRAALPSQTFDHWAMGADLHVDFRTRIGWTKLYGELVLGSNLDRALYVADPIALGDDLRELNWYVGFTQDLTPWAFVGLRYDEYDPNSDLVDNRRGQTIPADARLRTTSPIAGVRWPGYGRLTFQYDNIEDKLTRDVRGVPTDLKNNQWTLRVQGEF